MPGPVFRRGERVALHTLEREDLDLVARLRNDPELRRGPCPATPESDVTIERWFEDRVAETDASDEGAQFVVVPRGDPDVAAGYASLFDVQRPAGHGEIAVTIAPEHQDHGHVTDAVRELVAYGIEELRLNKIRGRALATDERWRAVLEDVGFRLGETRREARRVGGEHVDVVSYSLLADDWFDREDTVRGLPGRPPGATAAERGLDDPDSGAVDGGER
jgi:RimJ/RimL family protein N-acetyltransferase